MLRRYRESRTRDGMERREPEGNGVKKKTGGGKDRGEIGRVRDGGRDTRKR